MDLPQIQQELEKLYRQVDGITDQYHKAKTAKENLDGQTKTMLAFVSMGYEGSEAKIQRCALADEIYKKHLEALKIAVKDYNRTWALLEGLRIKMEILRSLNKNYNG